MSLNQIIASPISNVERKLYIKRRSLTTGLFETEWQDITSDVKSFGKIKKEVDATRPFTFKFANNQFTVTNTLGKYNPHDDDNSFWYGYLNQQRSLVRFDCSFFTVDRTSKEYYIKENFPENTLWDASYWDTDSAIYDSPGNTVFIGIISGDLGVNDRNDMQFNVKPLTYIFEEYAAKNLSGFTSTGLTASQFVTMVRDHQDASGNYVFRPFFGDTTTYWDISSTSNVYAGLDTSTSDLIQDQTVWNLIESLAEAENFVPFVTGNGVFKFVSRDTVSTLSAYEIRGAGAYSPDYGNIIKSINSYGFKVSKYYSRVRIKFSELDTTTSYVTAESDFDVSPTSNPWILGDRSLDIDNIFFQTQTVAQVAANALFNDVSALKREIEINTSLLLGLDIFDRFSVSYDPSIVNKNSLWDQQSWADSTADNPDDLYWDKTSGQQIYLNDKEFKFLSFEIDLDKLENNIIAREV